MSLETRNTTIAQFIAFAQQHDHKRWELIDGVITEVSPSSRVNTIITGLIIHYLNAFVLPRKLGYVTVPDGGYELGADIVRQPDAAFIASTRIDSLDGVTFSTAPDLAVEVISPSETPGDIRKKIDQYLYGGTGAVWVVYPDERVIDVWTLAQDNAKRVKSYKVGDMLDGGDVLPGFTVAVDDVFPDEQE